MKRLAAIALLCSAAAAEASVVAGESEHTLRVGDRIRSYRLFVPADLPARKKIPVVLVFHAGFSTAEKISKLTRFSFFAVKQAFIAVYPQALNGHWNDGREAVATPSHKEGIDDIGFIRTLLDTLAAIYSVDAARIYATGISGGAVFCHTLAARLSDRIAAIAPVGGGMAGPLATRFSPAGPVSIMIIHGTEDPIFPYGGGMLTGGEGGSVLGAEATAASWVRANGCSSARAETRMPDVDFEDGASAEVVRWRRCGGKTEVRLVRVVRGGHTWPGGDQYLPKRSVGRVCRDFFATTEILGFFHSRARR